MMVVGTDSAEVEGSKDTLDVSENDFAAAAVTGRHVRYPGDFVEQTPLSTNGDDRRDSLTEFPY